MPTPGYPVKIARIRFEMGIRKWTTRTLARESGISTTTINRILMGGNASPDTIEAFLTAFTRHPAKHGMADLISMQEEPTR